MKLSEVEWIYKSHKRRALHDFIGEFIQIDFIHKSSESFKNEKESKSVSLTLFAQECRENIVLLTKGYYLTIGDDGTITLNNIFFIMPHMK